MTFDPNSMPMIALNNGQLAPQLGLGVYKVEQDIAVDLVHTAVAVGYRRFDTAALYDNEQEIGAGLRTSGLAREDYFVTTKIWNDRHGFDSAIEAVDESLARLNLGYVDMLLIHWPSPAQNKFVETWKALESVVRSGRVRGIGVSNFNPGHLERLFRETDTVPALNQVELHPGLQQQTIRDFNTKHGIATEAWSPLARGRFNENETLAKIAAKHDKSVTQVIIRWHIQLENLVIPKSSNPTRLEENINVFDFILDNDDMVSIAALEDSVRIGPNPDDFG